MLDVLAGRGARPVQALVHVGIDPALPFAGPTDLVQESAPLTNLSEAGAGLATTGKRLVAVDVTGAFAYDPDHAARVTIARVEDDLVGTDRNPVAIWASGDPLSSRSSNAAPGREVREVFEAVVAGVGPSYGAITEEWPLLTPRAIARQPAADEDYRDFYLGLPRGDAARATVVDAAQGLTVVEGEDGIFVYSSRVFGGKGAPAGAASAAFAEVIRRTWGR